jgi:hypothetical protein
MLETNLTPGQRLAAYITAHPELDQAAIAELIDRAFRDAAEEVSDTGDTINVRPAHNFLGAFCAVPGCGLKRNGRLYCKKHDMRFRRHGDVGDRPRGRPRKEKRADG